MLPDDESRSHARGLALLAGLAAVAAAGWYGLYYAWERQDAKDREASLIESYRQTGATTDRPGRDR